MSKKKWTLDDMPSQEGKIVVITGGNSGLGFETAKAFAMKGAEVVIACRAIDKGNAAKESILKETPDAKIVVMALDLMSLSSVRSFAENFKQKYSRLDILINNAGIMTSPYALTEDGFESQMGTNHLGHFALTGLLLDLILSTPKSRIVNVSSLAHKQWKMSFENSLSEYAHNYNKMRAYSRSKLANLLFTYELQRRLEAANHDCIAVAAHPGASYTNLGRHLEHKLIARILKPLIIKVLPTPKSGAMPQIRAASDTAVKGGEYYGPAGLGELAGKPVKVKSAKTSYNLEDAKRLWEMSEELTGVVMSPES
ncbi:MAG: SDR family NAD(P)-dependent oxidoreductase [Bacteroidetes bacterium]|nr:SDR family NAD(P)-dependent oxidoreductase [Bacteroidota bacterium]